MNHDHHAHHETESQAATGEEAHFQEAHSTNGHVSFNIVQLAKQNVERCN
jgi:hypothetical protein